MVLFAISSAAYTCVVIFLFRSVVGDIEGFSSKYDLPVDFIAELNMVTGKYVFILAATGLVLTLFSLAWAAHYATRLFGPIVPITRLVKELRAGNYSARGQLRKDDALQELMADLNAFADDLEARTKSK